MKLISNNPWLVCFCETQDLLSHIEKIQYFLVIYVKE